MKFFIKAYYDILKEWYSSWHVTYYSFDEMSFTVMAQ